MARQEIERWGVFELALPGKNDGNPFTNYEIHGTFSHPEETVSVSGFYDGDGTYRIRFMPSFEGTYTYTISGTFSDATTTGSFFATAPTGNNHGPVRVAHQYHFAYADGTPHYSVGTTCYVFALQQPEIVEETFRELEKGYFNKIRFCLFPKHYDFNLRDPVLFPYEGTPMDASVLTRDNFFRYTAESCGTDPGNHWDFTRFNPDFFRHYDNVIQRLQDLNIQADIILFHPYDRWGFSQMPMEDNLRYLRYVAARYSAYRNVWWSMANEFDILQHLTVADWDTMATTLQAADPYHHLTSIHNCGPSFDHSHAWVSHCSLQRTDLYKTTETTDEFRQRFGKPVVWDEVGYEGNIPHCWGNLTAEELVRKAWEAAVRGGYCGHGETYLSEDEVLWWSHGGELKGEAPARLKFLQGFLKEVPGYGLKPGTKRDYVHIWWDDNFAIPEDPAYAGQFYFFYYGFFRPSYRTIWIDDDTWFGVDVIDTWNMTVTPIGRHKGHFDVQLPGTQYMGIRLRRSAEQSE